MAVHHREEELRFRHLEVRPTPLCLHELRGLVLGPRALRLVENDDPLHRGRSEARQSSRKWWMFWMKVLAFC
jgi:hypothetical protein